MVLTLAVIGATGKVGRHVVSSALEQGHRVVAIARSPEKMSHPAATPGLTRVQGDVLQAGSLSTALAGVDVVVSCVGITADMKPVSAKGTEEILATMADGSHGSRLVFLTALGMGDSWGQMRRSSWGGYFLFTFVYTFLVPFVRRDMNGAEAVAQASDVDYVIARPSVLTNKPGRGTWRESDASGRVGTSIPRQDVAAFMLREAVTPSYHREAVSIGT